MAKQPSLRSPRHRNQARPFSRDNWLPMDDAVDGRTANIAIKDAVLKVEYSTVAMAP